jgi:hypothetical protein
MVLQTSRSPAVGIAAGEDDAPTSAVTARSRYEFSPGHSHDLADLVHTTAVVSTSRPVDIKALEGQG